MTLGRNNGTDGNTGSDLTRRVFLATGAVGYLSAACGRKLASRYSGFLYVARRNQSFVTVVDLEQFRVAGKVVLASPPSQLVRAGARLFAVCPASWSIQAIDLEAQRASPAIRIPAQPNALLVDSKGVSATVASSDTGQLFRVDLAGGRVTARVQLPGRLGGFDQGGNTVSVTLPDHRTVMALDASRLRPKWSTELGVEPQLLRFRMDGKSLFAGAWAARQVLCLDADSGALLARLPLPVSPERFCFNSDGGQMFVNGAGGDVVTVVSPYQNEIDQTILAGRTPGDMVATSQGLLMVTNPDSGDLTIIDIQTRMLSASVHVGEEPGQVLVTPDNEFALVMSRRSGDVAVLRMKTILDHKNKTKPLFTVVPVGAQPISAVIMPRTI